MSKWDGYSNRILDAAQAKQIAGRAGRFGLHEPGESVGVATTLYSEDLKHLRKAVASRPKPLIGAYLSPGPHTFSEIASALPPNANQVTVFDALRYITPVRSVYRVIEHKGIEKMMNLINNIGAADSLRMEDKGLIILSPIPWNNPELVTAVSKCLQMYHKDMVVPLDAWLGDSPSMKYLQEIEEKIGAGKLPNSNPTALSLLESLHKCLVFYLWMSFRSPVVFYQQPQAHALKERVEKALDFSLRAISFTPRLRRSRTPIVHAPTGVQERSKRVNWMTRETLQKEREERDSSGPLRINPTPGEMYRAPVEIAKK
jgi:ATP-dependent RNA helicase SUPV3L1/SUV3